MIIYGKEIIPTTRLERIVAGERLKPVTRAEGIISGKDMNAITAFEEYLKQVFQDAVASAEALTRLEQILAGEDVDPKVRLDYLLKKRMEDPELPLGYTRVDKIDYDGTFWFDTGEKLMGNDVVSMTIDDTTTGGQNVFGCYAGTGSDARNFSLYIYGGGSSNSSYYRYGTQLLRPRFGSGEREIKLSNVTEGFTTDATGNLEEFETTSVAYIGNLPNSTSAKFTGNIVGAIEVADRLKWIPCERDEDGVVGYLEVYTGKFLEPVTA